MIGRCSYLLLVVFSLFIPATGCSPDEVVFPTKPPVAADEPKQYDTPFEYVPNTSDMIMYEVNLRAFSTTGDLKGVQGRLDEIKELGANVIWLMPIYPTGNERSIGSPYAIKDYNKVHPDFGDLEDLRLFVKEAHNREMAVILDWVANHTAWDHEWTQNKSWYTTDNAGNIVSPQGTGWNDVADLNYNASEMRKEMIQSMKYWTMEANVDGYRCDYADGVPVDFWKQAIDTLRSIPNRDIIMFAEGADKALFTAGFDLIFGWNFYEELNDVFSNNRAASSLYATNTADYKSVPEGAHILRWITNHDQNAWENPPVAIFGGQEGALAAFVITAYMGGVPLIYNGQEVGFTSSLPFFESASTRIDWSMNPGILEQYKDLLSFRKSSQAVKNGGIESFSHNDVVAFKRMSGGEEVLVIVNVRDKEVSFDTPASISLSGWQNAMDGEETSLPATLTLEPYAFLVLKN